MYGVELVIVEMRCGIRLVVVAVDVSIVDVDVVVCRNVELEGNWVSVVVDEMRCGMSVEVVGVDVVIGC